MKTIGFCKAQQFLDLGIDHFPYCLCSMALRKVCSRQIRLWFSSLWLLWGCLEARQTTCKTKMPQHLLGYAHLKLRKPHILLCRGSLGTTRLRELTWKADEVCWRQKWVQGAFNPQQCQVLVLGVPLFLRGSSDPVLQAQCRCIQDFVC